MTLQHKIVYYIKLSEFTHYRDIRISTLKVIKRNVLLTGYFWTIRVP
jgi:hypothetical protein